MLKQTLTPDVTVTTTVELAPVPRQMLIQRIAEDVQLAKQITALKQRRARNHEEIEQILHREGLGQQLLAGLTILGHKIKMVIGTSSKFDKAGFMRATGTTAADFAAHTIKAPKTPHLRVTGPGESDEEDTE